MMASDWRVVAVENAKPVAPGGGGLPADQLVLLIETHAMVQALYNQATATGARRTVLPANAND
jgi:hypothetical protein